MGQSKIEFLGNPFSQRKLKKYVGFSKTITVYMAELDDTIIPQNIIKYCKNKNTKTGRRVYKYYYIPNECEIYASLVFPIKHLIQEVDSLPFNPKKGLYWPRQTTILTEQIEELERYLFNGNKNNLLRKGFNAQLAREESGYDSLFQSIKQPSKLVKVLKEYDINNKIEYHEWLIKNHPDRGGDGELCAQIIEAGKYMGY